MHETLDNSNNKWKNKNFSKQNIFYFLSFFKCVNQTEKKNQEKKKIPMHEKERKKNKIRTFLFSCVKKYIFWRKTYHFVSHVCD